ncbi:hypothetical protein PYW08_001552 [Mythimna loreyi]|uniref:Uncharacterized protein n=1 Tax=Mythimna loreyi TaxID=667449 RepID=A0ACC2R6R2_9NEOP|nr:hypothetical protein PYW08_001552 [Mythimna loreyi]
MRVLVFIVAIFTATFATELSIDGVEELFRKFMRHELSVLESQQLADVIDLFHSPEHFSRMSRQNASEARMTMDCLICRSAFATLFEGVANGESDEELSNVIINLCAALNIESYPVCHGAVALNIPIITHIIKTTPEATPRAFCGLVGQSGDNPNACRIEDPRFEWEVELPAPAPVTNTPATDTRPLKIAVITDAHIDPLYEAFGVADCGEPVCCRIGQKPVERYVYKSDEEESIIEQSIKNNGGKVTLDLSVAKKLRELRSSTQTRFVTPRNAEPAGFWGDYRDCDTPIWAFDNVIDTITETHKGIDVVYYIGDTIDHGVWETTYELIDDMNRHLVDKIRKSFGDDVKVVPVIGNHESQPTNQFAPATVVGKDLNTTWLYDALVRKWGFYLDDEAKANLRDRGEFSIRVRPGLRVISLNNNVAYKFNWWLVYDPLDAKRHLEWLIQELYKAEQAGDKVHILAHIPPGVSDLTHTWTREYNRIVNRFSKTITAEFNGHTHSDEFKIFYNLTDGNPINMAWGAGSTTTYSDYNLNYKIFDFNPVTYLPESIVNYVYNLTEANLRPNRTPHWFQLLKLRYAGSRDGLPLHDKALGCR